MVEMRVKSHILILIMMVFVLDKAICRDKMMLGPCRQSHGGEPGMAAGAECDMTHVDLVLGGLVNLYGYDHQKMQCSPSAFLHNEVQLVEAMRHAIDLVNRNASLLPNVTMGYHIRDTCAHAEHALRQSAHFLNRDTDDECVQNSAVTGASLRRVVGVVGMSTSSTALKEAPFLNLFGIPLVSATATSPMLSDRTFRPNFLRTIPSDTVTGEAVAALLRKMEWSFVGIVFTDDAYGRGNLATIENILGLSKDLCSPESYTLQATDRCIAYRRAIPVTAVSSDPLFNDIWTDILFREPGNRADVVVVVVQAPIAKSLFRYPSESGNSLLNATALNKNVTFIGTETWGTSQGVLAGRGDIVAGALSPVPRTIHYEPFRRHWNSLASGHTGMNNPWLRQALGCGDNQTQTGSGCIGNRMLFNASFSMVFYVPYIYDAVQAYAVALDRLYRQCKFNVLCLKKAALQYVIQALKEVQFTSTAGANFSFDTSGDPRTTLYDIRNIQTRSDGSLSFTTVGKFTETTSLTSFNDVSRKVVEFQPAAESSSDKRSFHLSLNETFVVWNDGSNRRPVSQCSRACSEGYYRLVIVNGSPGRDCRRPTCCWHCARCSFNMFSDKSNANSCRKCSTSQIGNRQRNGCLGVRIEQLSFPHPVAKVTLVLSLLGFLTSGLSSVMYWRKRNCFYPLGTWSTITCGVGLLLAYGSMPATLRDVTDLSCTIRTILSAIGLTLLSSSTFVYVLHRLLIVGESRFSRILLSQARRFFLSSVLAMGTMLSLVFSISSGRYPKARIQVQDYISLNRHCGFHFIDTIVHDYFMCLNVVTSLLAARCIYLERRGASVLYPLDRRSSLLIKILGGSCMSFFMTCLMLTLENKQSGIIQDLFLHLITWQHATAFLLSVFCVPLLSLSPLNREQIQWLKRTTDKLVKLSHQDSYRHNVENPQVVRMGSANIAIRPSVQSENTLSPDIARSVFNRGRYTLPDSLTVSNSAAYMSTHGQVPDFAQASLLGRSLFTCGNPEAAMTYLQVFGNSSACSCQECRVHGGCGEVNTGSARRGLSPTVSTRC